jgi:DNA-binding response OmpR family regulator
MLPHKKRILCVDDDEDVCLMITNLLGFIGYQVTTAQTVPDALNSIRDDTFDLYLIDNWLPGGSGIDVCRMIRANYPKVAIVFYSAAAFEEDRRRAIEAGADAYFVKPTELNKLVDAIRQMFGEEQSLQLTQPS